MSEPIRVLVADDHTLFVQGLKAVLAAEADVDVVGLAGDGDEAVTLAGELAPDVILMDIRMPRMNGIAAAMAIKRAAPTAKIVMLTGSDEESDLYGSVKAGAIGYLVKDTPPHELADAIRAVHGGQCMLSPSIAGKMLSEYVAVVTRDKERPPSEPPLTPREIEVLHHIARGEANKQIATQLYISENTVKNHVRNILDKLHLHSRMEAAVYALRSGLLPEDRAAAAAAQRASF